MQTYLTYLFHWETKSLLYMKTHERSSHVGLVLFLIGWFVRNLATSCPLRPNIQIQILQTEFLTFAWRISWENSRSRSKQFSSFNHLTISHNLFYWWCINQCWEKIDVSHSLDLEGAMWLEYHCLGLILGWSHYCEKKNTPVELGSRYQTNFIKKC